MPISQDTKQSKTWSDLAEQLAQPPFFDITVAIPTHNGAARLPLVLDQLRSQIGTDLINWEVIVCDNGSTDDTAIVVRNYQASWPGQWPLHYRFAAQQGAAFARQRAVEVARGSLVAFLDDDNLPTENWVAQVYRFAQSHPQASVFGSQIHGQFETELPCELTDIKCFLAIIERGSEPHRYEPAHKILPPAAGLVVRKQVWLESVPARLFLNNKGKSAGLASEDLEAILYIQKSGHEVWYNPDMVVYHDIPSDRLNEDYLITLLRCVGLSRFHIRMLGLQAWQRPLAIPAYVTNDIRKLLLHRLRYPSRSQLSVVEHCRYELLTSTLASPFFLLKKACKDSLQTYRDQLQGDRYCRIDQLNQAFEQNLFALYQQPVVAITGADVDEPAQLQATGHRELLIRMRNADDSYALPGSFLPTAKRHGMMRALDSWVIRYVFDWASQRQDASLTGSTDPACSPLYSINLSQDSVADISLVQRITSKLAQTDLAPNLFCFEVTATVATTWSLQTRQLMAGLRQLGCRVTLDDATLGQTMMALNTDLPIDYVKFTPAVTQPTRRPSRGLWSQLHQAMQDSSVQVIAKGIDSEATLQMIRRQGIAYVQGYQTGRPQPLQAVAMGQ
ncbi:hormogonium polysaccharide biosynthesis glycosyltransferase HpsE [Leptolyngbya sp. BC1307]|uniref:hormogonium polysaccharide biosynthesis glycosyltransferase HpsE n=1 Tax=Leptolyngbya sp. BC1307 TaxID=2029589 RepID=UPI001F0A620C|nr:hormogonium polysaccharide biosynthesis glycosyltransferase HpsE [Leptolyngbya sp. BC1307]